MSRFARVLQVREFKTLVLAQFVSLFGDHVYFLVLLFIAKQVSKSNLEVGIVMTCQAVPFLVLGPLAGVVADRFDRRRIMALADLTSAALTLGLAVYALFIPAPPIWLIALTGLVLSSVNAFFMPARMAALPRLVPQDLLVEANAFFVTMQQVVAMVGVALSAIVLGALYKAVPEHFLLTGALLNSLTFAFSAYWVYRLPPVLPDRSESHDQTTWQEFKQGLGTVSKDGILKVVLPAMFLVQISISGFMVAYVEANEAWFGGEFSTFAWIELSFAAPMAIIGAFFGRFKITRPGLAYGLAIAFIGVSVALMKWADSFVPFVALNALAGLAMPFGWLPIQVYMQTAFPDSVRGRVSSVMLAIQVGSQPLSLMAVGPALDILGLGNVFFAMGLGVTASGLVCLMWRSCRDGRMPEPQAESGNL